MGKYLSLDGLKTFKEKMEETTVGADAKKQDKLTAGTRVDITSDNVINVSSITKNAYDYGFLPSNDAATNSAALQSAVAGGGTVWVDYPGTYKVSDTVKLESNTQLIFGRNVFISLQSTSRFLINEGAASREYNENISITGLNLATNGNEVSTEILGLRGYLAFFYVKNLVIDDFTLTDGPSGTYVIHICTFENIRLTNLHIEGKKDAVHIGRGTGFVIRDCRFKTYDDPIALNAHDYPSGQPEYGWIEDGVVENCYDLADTNGTSGYFCRILAGGWIDWVSGMSVQGQGDTVVSGGRIYCTNGTRGASLTSTVQPTHTSGTKTYSDGVTWYMKQEGDIHTAGCRNIHFRNIHLQKARSDAFMLYFDTDSYSRSYYPNADIPVQENITFEEIIAEAAVARVIEALTPIDCIKLTNCEFGNTKIFLGIIDTEGMSYDTTHVVMMGTTFTGSGSQSIMLCNTSRNSDLKVLGSVVLDSTFAPYTEGKVTKISNDIGMS